MFPKKKEHHKEEQNPATVEQPKEQLSKGEKPAEELQKQIESLKKEKDDIFAKLQRVAADYDNYQKRSARQLADSIITRKIKS